MNKSFQMIGVVDCEKKHFSYIIRQNRIISFAWNQNTTHPLLTKYGYGPKKLHSELAVLIPYLSVPDYLERCHLVNVRVNTAGEVRNSKPCIHCLKVLKNFNFKSINYSNNLGNFEELIHVSI